MRFWNSIVTKFAVFFTVLLVLSISIAGYFTYQQSIENTYKDTYQSLKHESELVHQAINGVLDEVRNDVGVLAGGAVFYDFKQNQLDTNAMVKSFKALLANKSNYYQIRLISAFNNGKELVRLDKKQNQIEVKPFSELQQKGDRDYFISTSKLNDGDIYFSQIDLNQEYGVVSIPLTPTLRAATPIFSENKALIGVLVINVNLTSFYSKVQSLVAKQHKVYIVDQTKQFVLHPAAKKQFALQLNHSNNLENEFDLNENPERLIEKSTQRTLLAFKKEIQQFNANQKLQLITVAPEFEILQNAQAIRRDILIKTVIIILVFLIASFIFSNLFASRIGKITNAISAFANNQSTDVKLPQTQNDELGLLTDSFLKMKSTIDEKVQDLELSLSETEKAKKDRDDFLQNMSHELRTPLNTITGMTELLKSKNAEEKHRPIINAIERSANNLSGLVYDILDHKKLVEGTIALEPIPTRLDEIIANCISIYKYEVATKNLKLDIEIDESIKKRYYKIDPLRFEQILNNLLTNAIKYTDKGVVKVELTEASTSIDLIVSDTGAGLSSEQLVSLNQLDSPKSSYASLSSNSFGLGLNIVIDLVKLFNASMMVTSDSTNGTSFKIQFKKEIAKANTETVSKDSLFFSFSEKLNVLHIEDDADHQLLVKEFLDFPFVEFSAASTVKEAEQLLKSSQFHIILSDLTLEQQNLESWLKKLKKREQKPVIAVSAKELEPTAEKLVCDLFLTKPYNRFALCNAVFGLWNQKEFNAPNFSAIYRDYDNDKEKIKRVFELLIEEFKTYNNRIANAFSKNDSAEWSAIQHKLIAHVKRLELNDIKEIIDLNLEDIQPEKRTQMLASLAFYTAKMYTERMVNLKG